MCYFENRIPLKPALAGVCSLENYSVAYEETQSNRVSDFRDVVCSLFPKAILFYFYFILCDHVVAYLLFIYLYIYLFILAKVLLEVTEGDVFKYDDMYVTCLITVIV